MSEFAIGKSFPFQVSEDEIEMLQKSFVDPTRLYSHGITLWDKRFAYLKVEKNALMGRSLTQACIVMRTDSGKHGCAGASTVLKARCTRGQSRDNLIAAITGLYY